MGWLMHASVKTSVKTRVSFHKWSNQSIFFLKCRRH